MLHLAINIRKTMNSVNSNTFFVLIGIVLIIFPSQSQGEDAFSFLRRFNKTVRPLHYNYIEAEFQKRSNATAHNKQISEQKGKEFSAITEDLRTEARNISLHNVSSLIRRQFKLLLMSDSSSNATVRADAWGMRNRLMDNYASATVLYNSSIIKSIQVNNGTTQLKLAQLTEIFEKSRDPDELQYVWELWRDAIGPLNKDIYKEYIQLRNIGARENGFEDVGDYSRRLYEVENLEDIAENFWKGLQPFYKELHAYVRFKLSKVYPKQVKLNEPLPAHLLGNMWAQEWTNIFELIKPYKDEPTLSLTPLLRKKLNVSSMFKISEEFFVSLGWPRLPKIFWERSMFEDPKDRPVSCHPSAWDFGMRMNGEKDSRILMCSKVTEEDFNTVHHEMGHVYYYLFYWDQPFEFRTGANPGFHEAIGDAIILSVQTPQHLQKIGLLGDVSNSAAADINFLLKAATKSISFLPFGYLVDNWVWNIYNGNIQPSEYNQKWWEMRLKYQGVKPPTERNEIFFDAAAKFHVSADVPYIRYFFAIILKYTFHKHACKETGNTQPLYKCSIFNSTKAGSKLREMLTLGKSKPWPEALEVLTGSRALTAEPINEYYKPLIDWLRAERRKQKYPIGWEERKDIQSSAIKTRTLNIFNIFFALFLALSLG